MSEVIDSYKDIFDSLTPSMLSNLPDSDFLTKDVLEKTIASLRSNFEDDYKRALEAEELLFSSDVSAYGQNAADYFTKHNDMLDAPKLTGYLALAIEKFGIDVNTPLGISMLAVAILAEVPNDMQYHGNAHYRKVVLHTMRLITKHNEIHENGDLVLTPNEIALLLISACIHDLGHQGGDNLRDGFYTPGAMEQHSFDLAFPFLEEIGLDRDDTDQIETLVFCTDITFFAGENSPCVCMKQIYKHYIWNDDKKEVGMMMIGKLRLFYENPKLALMAMILHEADVGSSAGLCYEQTITETISFMDERGMNTAGPNIVLAFLRDQLGETMFTEAGKQIFGPAMLEVIKKAEEDIKNGRENFYDD